MSPVLALRDSLWCRILDAIGAKRTCGAREDREGTRVIEFELRMTRDFPTYNDGYADNLSFRLARMSLRSLISGAKAV
jgi:hypothetical protein